MLDYQQKFFKFFFEYIDQNKINHIIHLGDLVDRRKFINYNTARRMREMFLDEIDKRGISCDIIVGNHDVTYKNTNELNALRELVDGKYSNICIFDQPVEVAEALYLPWITADNREKTFQLINETKKQIVFGHLELQGFLNNDGQASDFGDDPKLFQKFDMVMTGHFHTRITKDNIYYLGCPYQMTWSDYANDKGFHIFDTKKRKLEFIKNPNTMFVKLYYNDSKFKLAEMQKKAQDANIADAYVKIVVEEKSDPYKFDLYLGSIEKLAPFDLKVVETKSLMLYDNDIDQAEDTLSILKKSIPALDVSVDKTNLERLIVNLYGRANTVEL